MLLKARTDSLGHLSWPVIVKSVERVITDLDEAA